jgi:hypothetical protein
MDPLYDLLVPHTDQTAPSNASGQRTLPRASNAQATTYLNRLSSLSLSDLTSTEPASLLQGTQSHIRNLQALAKRSHKVIINSSSHLEKLKDLLPEFNEKAGYLKEGLPGLEGAASEFAKKYDRSADNEVLERRKRAMLLSRNADRLSDVLELPTLLSSTVAAAQVASTASASSTTTSYASALDLHAHIKRLTGLYPNSELIAGISRQAEAEINDLTTILITTLQSPGLKLAAAMRTVGWLRRVAPELVEDGASSAKLAAVSTRSFDVTVSQKPNDGALGSLFLVCRLHALHSMLDALEPLRDLADQESTHRGVKQPAKQSSQHASFGTQSERFLKRYIEIFREQSFNIVSMYKSVFPHEMPGAAVDGGNGKQPQGEALLPLPAPVSSFILHLVEMLKTTLKSYMPNITDKSARESLLTQVLYCAGSLGRLGADFSMMIALLEEEMAEGGDDAMLGEEPEWAQVMKKHRVQASRLEVLARGVGSGARKGSSGPLSPSTTAAVG